MTMYYLMKSKYAIISNIKVTEIERSSFWGDTRYNYTVGAKCFHTPMIKVYVKSTEKDFWHKHLLLFCKVGVVL